MSEHPSLDDTSIPFVCQRLGILPEQPFVVNGYPERTFPVLIYQDGQIRRYIPGARNKGHKLGGGAVCWLMEHPEAVTMRQDPITENDVNEEDDMSENKKPRMAEVLGVEVGEKFDMYNDEYNPYFVDEDGYLHDCENDKLYNVPCEIINNPDLIKRRPRWTQDEIKAARLLSCFRRPSEVMIGKNEYGVIWWREGDKAEGCLPGYLFPSLEAKNAVKLLDIIGGNE